MLSGLFEYLGIITLSIIFVGSGWFIGELIKECNQEGAFSIEEEWDY